MNSAPVWSRLGSRIDFSAVALAGFLVTFSARAQVPAVVPGLRVSGLRDHYCTATEKIPLAVENATDEDLYIGFLVEKKVPNGEWWEYWPDIRQQRRYTKAMATSILARGTRGEFAWDLRRANDVFPLEAGDYRLVACIWREGEAPPAGRRLILGSFFFIACPATPTPAAPGPR